MADLAMADLAMADLAMADLAVAELAIWALPAADLATALLSPVPASDVSPRSIPAFGPIALPSGTDLPSGTTDSSGTGSLFSRPSLMPPMTAVTCGSGRGSVGAGGTSATTERPRPTASSSMFVIVARGRAPVGGSLGAPSGAPSGRGPMQPA